MGSEACRGCHEEVARHWEGTPHELAIVEAKGPRRLAPTGAPLRMLDGRLVVDHAAVDAHVDVPIDFAIGRRRLEQPIGTLTPGRLQALPLAYDLGRRAWFDLFEGDPRQPTDWGHWTNRGMVANSQCLFCHTTGFELGYDAGADVYNSRWVELGVGCEACHGPGADHVAHASNTGGHPYGALDVDALFDTCASCHSRRVERAPYTPGAKFLDSFDPELLDSEAFFPDGQVHEELYEAVSFQTSTMFARGVRCWNCHDVHRGSLRAQGNALCLQCHDRRYDGAEHTHHRQGSAGAACASCHMPVTVYMQRDPRHDHSFSSPDPEATIELGVPNACNRCHTDRDARWASAEVDRWFPIDGERRRRRTEARVIAGGRRGDIAYRDDVSSLVSSGRDVIRRASGARLLHNYAGQDGVTATLISALRDPEPLVRASAAWALSQGDDPSPEVRAALLHAAADPVRVVRQHAGFGLRSLRPAPEGDRALPAMAEWRAGQDMESDTPEAHYNLGVLWTARNELEKAETSYRNALKLWPQSVQARHNLGMLLARGGTPELAIQELTRLLDVMPVAESAFSLALLHAQLEQWDESIRRLEQCLEISPEYPRARYNLGLALAKKGDYSRSLAELERATADPPSRRDAVLAIIDVARVAGDRDRVERWVLEAAEVTGALRDPQQP